MSSGFFCEVENLSSESNKGTLYPIGRQVLNHIVSLEIFLVLTQRKNLCFWAWIIHCVDVYCGLIFRVRQTVAWKIMWQNLIDGCVCTRVFLILLSSIEGLALIAGLLLSGGEQGYTTACWQNWKIIGLLGLMLRDTTHLRPFRFFCNFSVL